MTEPIRTDGRPLGYWIDAVGRSLAHSLERPLSAAGIDRSAWRTLTVLERGPASEAELTGAMPPDEAESPRPLTLLADRGWIEPIDARWQLTATGRDAHDAILLSVSDVRRTVTDGITPHDYATTLATLEHIVNNLAAASGAQDAAGSRIA
jgi:hypothetical protein